MSRSVRLLGRRSPRWPSASAPPKIIIVSELFVLVLSLLGPGPISILLASSMWELRSLSLHVCPAPLWWVVIMWVLYVVQYNWYLSLIFPRMVLSGECTHSLLLLGHPVMCRAFNVSSMVESLTRQEWQWACCCVVWPSAWLSSCEVPMKLCLVVSFLVG